MRAHTQPAPSRAIAAALVAAAIASGLTADGLATERVVLGEIFSADG